MTFTDPLSLSSHTKKVYLSHLIHKIERSKIIPIHKKSPYYHIIFMLVIPVPEVASSRPSIARSIKYQDNLSLVAEIMNSIG
jgi:hypothetical protein